MNVAHIVGTFPPQVGGMGQVVEQEAKELVERGHQVTVFTLRYPATVNLTKNTHSFSIKYLRPWLRGGDAGWLPTLLIHLRNFDIVHLHYPFYGGAEWVWLAKVFFGQKYLVTYHMTAAPTRQYQKMIHRWYDRWITPHILRQAERVIIVDENNFKLTRWSRLLPLEKIVKLSNPVDTNIFKPRSSLAASNKKILLFVGNLLPVKGLDLLLRALKLLPAEVVLMVVGGGYEEKTYRNLAAELGISNRVLWMGKCLDRKMLAQYYAEAWCTVIPSLAESFSLVAIESLAGGTPVVGSSIPGLAGRVNPGVDGLLFELGSEDGLAKQLQTIINFSSEQRNVMGEAGRKKVAAQYGLIEHVSRLESIYREATSA